MRQGGMRPDYHLFVGADTAAASVTVAWQVPGAAVGRPITIEQTPAGFAALRQRLLATGRAPATILVVMEATGSSWLALAQALAAYGFAVGVINPLQAHHFAKALLRWAKTDAIDAQTVAQLAALLQPSPWTPVLAFYSIRPVFSQFLRRVPGLCCAASTGCGPSYRSERDPPDRSGWRVHRRCNPAATWGVAAGALSCRRYRFAAPSRHRREYPTGVADRPD